MFSNVLKNNFSSFICILIIVSHPVNRPVNKIGTFGHVIITQNVTKIYFIQNFKICIPTNRYDQRIADCQQLSVALIKFQSFISLPNRYSPSDSDRPRDRYSSSEFSNDSKSPCWSQSSYLSVSAESLSVHRLSFAFIECFRLPALAIDTA